MASRPRCSKRGSTGKDAPAQRKPLGDISALHNTSQPPTRKYQKTCTADAPAEVKPRPHSRSKQVAAAAVAAASTTAKTKSMNSSQIHVLSEPEPELRIVTKNGCGGSDVDEQSSSDSSPHQPSWFHSVPQKHRQAVESMLGNSGASIPPKERDVIIRDCCDTFKAEGHAEEFLEWITVQERVSSLTTKLCQTTVWSNVPTTGALYADEIYDNLLAREERFGIIPDYMESVQRDITHNMRSILVDWLVEVGEEYKLSSQTLFLAVNYVDRLLGLRSINRNKLQLLGITCMLVAAKYEEIYPPTIDEFVYISDNTYTRRDVLTMESILLTALKFNLSAPTSWEFVRGFCCSANIGDRPKFLAHFLSELVLMFPCSLKYRPSVIAASAIFLALYTLHLSPWVTGLLRLAGNNQDLLQQCVEELHGLHKKVTSEGHSLKAIKDKFQDSKWLRVSLIPSRSLDLN